jgi:hypothetical protein
MPEWPIDSTRAHDRLARFWNRLNKPYAEWSLRVDRDQTSVRPKWLAWLGACPETPDGLAALFGDLGFHNILIPEDHSRVNNVGIGFHKITPVCLYVALSPGPNTSAIIRRYGANETCNYTFLRFDDDACRPVLQGMAPDVRPVVDALMQDPVVCLHSGCWIRESESRVYVTFPHEPPIRRLRALLRDFEIPADLAAYDDLNFRHLAVIGDGSGEMTVYMQASTNRLPDGLEDARRLIALALPWHHASDTVQQMIAEAERKVCSTDSHKPAA